jgi:prepilin-type N-terminal cleavage/methylation domain-containing protein
MGHGFCMTLPSTRKRFHGFSLMEVMIVVVIIGILAALAYPNLEKYLKRARQTEAKTNLSAIYTAQKIYYTLHQSYAEDIKKLDLSLAQGLYTFTIQEASKNTFKAQAKGNIDDDDALDIWTIDQNKILFNDNDNVTAE